MKMKPTPRPPAPRHAPRRIPPRRTLQARAATSREEIDDYESEAEPNMKLSHAFMVVLVLHLLAVGGVFAFNSLKSPSAGRDRSTTKPAAEQPAPEVVSTAAAPAAAPAAPAKPAAPATTGESHTVVAGDTLTRIASKYDISVEQLEKANGLTAGATIRVGQVLQLPAAPSAKTAEAPKPALVPAAKPAAPEAAKPVVAKAPEAPVAKAPVTAPKTAEAKPAAPSAPKDAAPASGSTYVVAKGDNPYSIAKKLKVSYNELIKANKIEDPTKLQIGQKLVVP